jgi:SpoVK/Ycf46/Vps4 family AAA+-type ATPase
MVGMDGVSAEVDSLVAEAMVNRRRAEQGLPIDVSNYHLVFSGNPGTGKTTVARDIAKIYNGLGILPTDKFVEVGRADLVAGFAGQTALKVRAAFEKAKGGVLFIDEAYALKQGENDSYGQEAIDTLLPLIENNKANTVVIVAGYPNEMRGFLKTNPGIARRFPTNLNFRNFTEPELGEIMRNKLTQGQYTIGKGAEAKQTRTLINERLAVIANSPSSGNAGDVNNFFERIRRAQAIRLAQTQSDDLKSIKPEDVALGWQMMSDSVEARTVTGSSKKGKLVKP